MTDNKHPITPPPELVQQWLGTYFGTTVTGEVLDVELVLATQAARWGADVQLEACEKYWMTHGISPEGVVRMREHLRPKPPSPKEEALQVLENLLEARRIVDPEYQALRHALEQLDD